MRLNLVTGQIYLTQNTTGNAAGEDENTDTTVTPEAEGENAEGAAVDGDDVENTEGAGDVDGALVEGEGTVDAGMEGEPGIIPGMDGGMGGQTVKDPILSNWFFVGGVSAGTLIVSIVLGILLAKRRIKKGIELYED